MQKCKGLASFIGSTCAQDRRLADSDCPTTKTLCTHWPIKPCRIVPCLLATTLECLKRGLGTALELAVISLLRQLSLLFPVMPALTTAPLRVQTQICHPRRLHQRRLHLVHATTQRGGAAR